MNSNFFEIVYLVKHGSHAYGLNIETSDVDEKGICVVKDLDYYIGLKTFEQKDSGWDDGVDRVIWDIRKFFRLALACNPSVIEILYVEEEDILHINGIGKLIRMHRDSFLSKKAANTFVGYALSQLKKIKLRKQLHEASMKEPKKADFTSVHHVIGEMEKVYNGHTVNITSPHAVVEHFDGPAFDVAVKKWKNYISRVKNRNPARAALEAKHQFDTKHAMHLVRLLTMGKEILKDGKVNVRRPDRDYLLSIRNGKLSYDELIKQAEHGIEEINSLVASSPLPDNPDIETVNQALRYIMASILNKV